MPGLRRPTQYVPREARDLLGGLSKAAIFDMAAGLALIGTDESEAEITAHLCREAVIVCRNRGDRLPSGVAEAAARRIDSDPPAD